MPLDENSIISQERAYNAAQKAYTELCTQQEYSKALQEQHKMHAIIVIMHHHGYYLDQDPFTSEFIFTQEGY